MTHKHNRSPRASPNRQSITSADLRRPANYGFVVHGIQRARTFDSSALVFSVQNQHAQSMNQSTQSLVSIVHAELSLRSNACGTWHRGEYLSRIDHLDFRDTLLWINCTRSLGETLRQWGTQQCAMNGNLSIVVPLLSFNSTFNQL